MDFKRIIYEKLVSSFNSKPYQKAYSVLTTTIWPDYLGRNGSINFDFDKIHEFHNAIEAGISHGIFKSKKDDRGNLYRQITAEPHQIMVMAKEIGYNLRPDFDNLIITVLNEFQASCCPQVSSWCKKELEDSRLAEVTSFFKFDPQGDMRVRQSQLRMFLAACEGIYALTDDTPVREFSVRYFNGSKDLEKHYIQKITKVMAREMAENQVEDKEILKTLHLLFAPPMAFIKGHGRITFKNGDCVTLTGRTSPIALSKDYVDDIMRVDAARVLTIENLTTFQSHPCNDDWLIIYNKGYAHHLVVSLLVKIARDNALQETYHFGDMDAYGFDILRNLAARTNLKVLPYCMSINFYDKNLDHCITMNESNYNLFKKLLQDPYFSEHEKTVFAKLLQDNKILEQEAILWT